MSIYYCSRCGKLSDSVSTKDPADSLGLMCEECAFEIIEEIDDDRYIPLPQDKDDEE